MGYFKVHKNYYKGSGSGYYKVRKLVLQSGTGCIVTKYDNFITKWDVYYKVGRILQSGSIITKWSLTAVHEKCLILDKSYLFYIV